MAEAHDCRTNSVKALVHTIAGFGGRDASASRINLEMRTASLNRTPDFGGLPERKREAGGDVEPNNLVTRRERRYGHSCDADCNIEVDYRWTDDGMENGGR